MKLKLMSFIIALLVLFGSTAKAFAPILAILAFLGVAKVTHDEVLIYQSEVQQNDVNKVDRLIYSAHKYDPHNNSYDVSVEEINQRLEDSLDDLNRIRRQKNLLPADIGEFIYAIDSLYNQGFFSPISGDYRFTLDRINELIVK
jgi:hypothetical protein